MGATRKLPDLKANQRADQQALNTLPPSDQPRPIIEACARPIPNSYWATPFLLACEYPYTPYTCSKSQKINALLQSGVRTFIDLTEEGELYPYSAYLSTHMSSLNNEIDPSEIEYHRFPIPDRCLPPSLGYLHSILSVLHSNASRNRITAVHCRGGIGRTGVVVGCWLVESGVATNGEDALGIIGREWRGVEKCVRYPLSPETGPQFEFVRSFERGRGDMGEKREIVGSIIEKEEAEEVVERARILCRRDAIILCGLSLVVSAGIWLLL